MADGKTENVFSGLGNLKKEFQTKRRASLIAGGGSLLPGTTLPAVPTAPTASTTKSPTAGATSAGSAGKAATLNMLTKLESGELGISAAAAAATTSSLGKRRGSALMLRPVRGAISGESPYKDVVKKVLLNRGGTATSPHGSMDGSIQSGGDGSTGSLDSASTPPWTSPRSSPMLRHTRSVGASSSGGHDFATDDSRSPTMSRAHSEVIAEEEGDGEGFEEEVTLQKQFAASRSRRGSVSIDTMELMRKIKSSRRNSMACLPGTSSGSLEAPKAGGGSNFGSHADGLEQIGMGLAGSFQKQQLQAALNEQLSKSEDGLYAVDGASAATGGGRGYRSGRRPSAVLLQNRKWFASRGMSDKLPAQYQQAMGLGKDEQDGMDGDDDETDFSTSGINRAVARQGAAAAMDRFAEIPASAVSAEGRQSQGSVDVPVNWKVDLKALRGLHKYLLVPIYKRSPAEIAYIFDRVRALPSLRNMTVRNLHDLCGYMTLRTVKKGELVFAQGDSAEHFFIILKGRVDVLVAKPGAELATPTKVNSLSEGESFGEVAFLRECDRTATIRVATAGALPSHAPVEGVAKSRGGADGIPKSRSFERAGTEGTMKSHSSLRPGGAKAAPRNTRKSSVCGGSGVQQQDDEDEAWFIIIPRTHYMASVKRLHQKELHDKLHFIKSLPVFAELNSAELNELMLQMEYKMHVKDEIFAREGTAMDYFMAVKSGRVREAKMLQMSEQEFNEKRHSKPADAVVEEELYGNGSSPRAARRAREDFADPGGACTDVETTTKDGKRNVSILVSEKGPGDVLGWFDQSPAVKRPTSFIADSDRAVVGYISAYNMNNLRHRFAGVNEAKAAAQLAAASDGSAGGGGGASGTRAAASGPSPTQAAAMQEKLKRVYRNQKAEKEWDRYKKKVLSDLYKEKERKRDARRGTSFF